MRIKIFKFIVFAMFAVILWHLFYVQAVRGDFYYRLSANNRIRVVPLEGRRGRVFDSEGRVLAENRLTFNASIVPQEIQDKDALFDFLSSALKEKRESINRRYQQRMLTPFAPVVIGEDISREAAIVLEENAFRFPGLLVQESFERSYPFKEVGAHVVGYVGRVNRSELKRLKEYGYSSQTIVGKAGVEDTYDTYLLGGEGGRQIEVNSRGRQVRLISFKDAAAGQDIALTVNQQAQDIAYEILDGRKGSVIVIDPSDGGVLAMVNYPSFDPNVFTDKTLQHKLTQYYQNNDAPLLDRAVKGLYPPGSVFKIPVAVAALEDKKITRHTTYNCPGYMELGGRRFGCTHIHHDEDLVDSIAHSCNVYYYQIGLKLGPERITHYARMFGFGEPTGIDLPFEQSGNLLRPSRRGLWYQGDTLNLSIGQGDVLATPLQAAVMMATIANDGQAVRPHVIRSIGGKSIVNAEVIPARRNPKQHIDRNTLRQIQEGMRAVVSYPSGTGHDLDMPGLMTYGKTGTAQSGGTRPDHSWFAGYTRSENRTLAFCVFLEHGGSSHNAVLLTRLLLTRLRAAELL